MQYTIHDIGCYADGGFGHDHVREVLANMMHDIGEYTLEAELRMPMSDDAGEEQEALDYLTSHCSTDVAFVLEDGDLLLVKV